MTARPRNYSNIPRVCARAEKVKKVPNYQTSPSLPTRADYANYPGDYRYSEQRNNYPVDYPTDNEYRASDDRSSNESLSYCDPNVDQDPDQNFYAPEPKGRERVLQNVTYAAYSSQKRSQNYTAENYEEPTYRPGLQRKSQDHAERRAHETSNDVQASLTTQKLQRLRELQRRRDYTERYYSQEIRRLIGDAYVDARPIKEHQDKPFAPVPNNAGDRGVHSPVSSLEPCGTMTTITRLDCGCVEQTVRPIFTTSAGRTRKRSCAQEQQLHMRMSAPNARLVLPGRHQPTVTSTSHPVYPAHHQQQAQNYHQNTQNPQNQQQSRLKSRSYADQRATPGVRIGGVTSQDQRAPGTSGTAVASGTAGVGSPSLGATVTTGNQRHSDSSNYSA
ncbi:hypothetical protein QAD02_014762 [Eretmocerus hayati]|uniref:Uncharacterized protein n=1 Tax=Eretmocerus hayati TaxID=131215 RepID=A0ACC2PB42_9HYME|nr:hypothetical protein QAD02_014762 [Eretmocerus hayati]